MNMEVDDCTAMAVGYAKTQRQRCASLVVKWLLIFAGSLTAAIVVYLSIAIEVEGQLVAILLVVFLTGYSIFNCSINLRAYRRQDHLLQQFHGDLHALSMVMAKGTAEALASLIVAIKAKKNTLSDSLLEARQVHLAKLIESRHREELFERLDDEVNQFKEIYKAKATEIRNRHPLYRAYIALDSAEQHLKQRRVELDADWKRAYVGFSWWNKLKYGDTPDFKELDEKLRELDIARRSLLAKHSGDLDKLNVYYGDLASTALERVTQAAINIEAYIRQSHYEDTAGNDVFKKGALFATLSVPVSIWNNVDRAGDVYDVLRSVNGNYAGLSDAEIWWETVLMPSESLAGLVSLTKGAYLESLVASDSGGQLFEHFNHPDTDIVIDGIAFQVKATDSADYINSVADGIPVIATSEVAGLTGAIDSGYTNDELAEAVGLAVGGSVIDVGDTAVDAILSGVGGLGLFATLAGINHAADKYNNGGDPVEAMFEGAGIAIEGTARAAVNTLELGYNILNSRPSRFVGRMMLKGAKAIDRKLTGEG